MIRKFIRWLAREDIDHAIELGKALASLQKCTQHSIDLGKAYMLGAQAALDAMENAVKERMGGVEDLIKAEDIERAKKGLLH